jgi:hypothetical protein
MAQKLRVAEEVPPAKFGRQVDSSLENTACTETKNGLLFSLSPKNRSFSGKRDNASLQNKFGVEAASIPLNEP